MSKGCRRVTLVASRDRVAALGPLLDTWADEGTVRIEAGPAQPDLSELAEDSDAVLVIGDRNRAPRTVLPGTVLRSASGRIVPAGWLPDTGPESLRRFATCAAAVHARARGSRRTLAVLSQRHSRFGALADKVVRLVEEERSDVMVCRWTAYDVHRDDLAVRLSRGPALGVYLGHGRPIGWVGYAGLRARHIGQQVDPAWLPAGAVLSLTCKTASRRNTGLSFAESIPLNGVAAATLGAVGPTLHTDNARWAVRIVRILPRVETVGELIAEVAAADPAADTFRLVGDPTAPLLDAPSFTTD
jgi:hypothetical protein